MYDLWLFFELKKLFRGKKFQSGEEIDVDVKFLFDSIPKDSWSNAFKLQKRKLVKCVIVKGNYFKNI